jgi:glycosyltransferase involved in cell wall biosynthesis
MSLTSLPRILHVMQPSVAGVPMAVIELVAHQRASGIDARIAAPDENDLPARCEDRGIPFIAWTASRNVGRSLFAEMRSLRRIITDVDPAIVHLHSSKAGLAGRLVLRRTRTTVFSPHGWSFFVPSRTQSLALRWERFAARWTSQFHVCCDDEARVGAENGVVGDYFSGLNGVDALQFGFSDESARNHARRDLQIGDGPTVVCIGRICHQKGQDLLLEAWQQIVDQIPGARLYLVGGGEDAAGLRATAPDSVTFVGDQRDVRPWIAAADLVAAPSRYEGLSTAVLESLIMGRAVVAYDAVGMHSLIGDQAGEVVPIGEADVFAAAILRRLRDTELCATEGRAGRERVRSQFATDVLLARALDNTRTLLELRSERNR